MPLLSRMSGKGTEMRGGGASGVKRPAPRRVSATAFSAGKEGRPPRKGRWRMDAIARSPTTTIRRSVGSDQEGNNRSGPDRGCQLRRIAADAPARASTETSRGGGPEGPGQGGVTPEGADEEQEDREGQDHARGPPGGSAQEPPGAHEQGQDHQHREAAGKAEGGKARHHGEA